MKKMNDCIFCKIIHKEIPSYTIYEDRDVLAILDTFPASYGHVLILSKKHYQNILECDETTLNSMAKAIKKIGLTLEKNICYRNQCYLKYSFQCWANGDARPYSFNSSKW